MGNWPRCEFYRTVTIIGLSLFDLIRGSKTQRLNVVSSLTLKWKRGVITKRLKSNYFYNCIRREKRWCNEIPMQQELLSSYSTNSGSFRIMALKARTVLHLSMLSFIYFLWSGWCLQFWCASLRDVHPWVTRSWKKRTASRNGDKQRTSSSYPTMFGNRPSGQTKYGRNNWWNRTGSARHRLIEFAESTSNMMIT